MKNMHMDESDWDAMNEAGGAVKKPVVESTTPFETGTRAYGPARPDSDLDIVMLLIDADALKGNLMSFGIFVKPNPDPEYFGYEFKLGNFPTVNIIAAPTVEQFKAWRVATEMMKLLEKPIEDRAKRIAYFQKIFTGEGGIG